MNQNIIAVGISEVMALARATGLFVSTCTIYAPTGAFGVSGAQLVYPNGYAAVPSVTNVKCMKAPTGVLSDKILASEIAMLREILTMQPWHVLLDNYYAAVDSAAGQLAVIDGIVYELFGNDHDSQFQMTRLSVRLNKI